MDDGRVIGVAIQMIVMAAVATAVADGVAIVVSRMNYR